MLIRDILEESVQKFGEVKAENGLTGKKFWREVTAKY